MVFHILIMLPRIIYPTLGIAYWMKAYDKIEDSPDTKLDVDRVESSKTFVYTSLIVWTVIGVVLDIVCVRCRSLARWIAPHEMVYTIVYFMVPWDYGDFEIYFTTIYLVIGFILLSSKMHVDAILMFITMLCI